VRCPALDPDLAAQALVRADLKTEGKVGTFKKNEFDFVHIRELGMSGSFRGCRSFSRKGD
jgi:hypothetical protein